MCEGQCLNEAQLLIGWSFFGLWSVKKKWVSGARGAGLQRGLMWTERETPHEREEGMISKSDPCCTSLQNENLPPPHVYRNETRSKEE